MHQGFLLLVEDKAERLRDADGTITGFNPTPQIVDSFENARLSKVRSVLLDASQTIRIVRGAKYNLIITQHGTIVEDLWFKELEDLDLSDNNN